MLNFDNYSSETVKAKVELYNGSTLVQTCTCSNYLEDFTLSRAGITGKFFGFGICQSLDINFIDLHSDLTVEKGNTAEIAFGDGSTYWNYPYPKFYLTEVNRDEKNASINAVAYDGLYRASELTFNDLHLSVPYNMNSVLYAIARALGLSTTTLDGDVMDITGVLFEKGANFNGDESLRSVLDSIAEASQSIYFVDNENCLRLRRLQHYLYDDNCNLIIPKTQYYELNSGDKRTLTGICHATELGNNYLAASDEDGITQYIRNNPFWEVKSEEEIVEAVEAAFAAVGGMQNQQFDCDWAGDYRLVIGDSICIVGDNFWVHSYVLNDTITYDGTLNEFTEWSFDESNDGETLAHPTNIKEALDKTYARVDKIEKEITLYVGELVDEAVQGKVDDAIDESLTGIVTDVNNLKSTTETHSSQFAELELTTSSLNATVSSLQQSNTAISSEIENVKGEQTKIKSDLAEINVTTEEISASVSSLETTNTELTKRVTTNEGNIKTLTNSQSETNSKVASLTTSLDGIEGRVETLENTTETSIALEKINDDISNLKTEQTTIKNNIAALQVKDNEIAGSVSSLQSTTTKISGDLSSVSSTVDTMQSEIDTMDGELTTAQGHIVQVAQGLVDLGNQTANLFTDVNVEQTTMKEDIAALKVKDTEITASVSGLESTTTTLSTDVDGVIAKQETMEQDISQLKLDKNSITANVTSLEQTISEGLGDANEKIQSLEKKSELAITSEDVSIQISEALEDGVTKVKTTTGYTFDDEGLHISKTGSAMTSTLDENGLVVSNHSSNVLEALPSGVSSLNLTARQYLKVGGSRFQTYGYNRTGCYWIGD